MFKIENAAILPILKVDLFSIWHHLSKYNPFKGEEVGNT